MNSKVGVDRNASVDGECKSGHSDRLGRDSRGSKGRDHNLLAKTDSNGSAGLLSQDNGLNQNTTRFPKAEEENLHTTRVLPSGNPYRKVGDVGNLKDMVVTALVPYLVSFTRHRHYKRISMEFDIDESLAEESVRFCDSLNGTEDS